MDVGLIDVIGVKNYKGHYSETYEIIGVEVKPKTFHFGKKIGQTLGYALSAHRVYLACYEQFNQPQIQLASRMGVGLIEIKNNKTCEEIIGSRVFEPDPEKQRLLLSKMCLGECMFCGTIIDLEKKYSSSLHKASKHKIPYEFYRKVDTKFMASFKGKKETKTTYQRFFLCVDCVGLFGKHYKFG